MELEVTSEQWTLVKSICFKALEIDAGERDNWISEQTELPSSVVAEVRRLIDAAGRESNFDSQTAPSQPRSEFTPSLEGTTLLNRFEVVRHLGSGAMGDVYSAFDRQLDEGVAIKMVRRHLAEQVEMIAGLRREVQLARRVRHPNVCQIFELHQDLSPLGTPLLFYTMELLLGDTLSAHISGRVLSLPQALDVATGLAHGLDAIHRSGLVHRDLKPANVFLVEEPGSSLRTVITDFGLCFDERRPVTETLTLFGPQAIVGTPAYMAPEQLLGQGAVQRSDVYAFGVILFEMVTGRLPFEGETPLAIALRRLNEKAPSPRSFNRELPWRWEHAILACLKRDPANRPSSALDVIAMLNGRTWPLAGVLSRRELGVAGVIAACSAIGIEFARHRRSPHTPVPKAEYHLKLGIEFSSQSTPTSIRSAIDEIKQAVAIDPKYGEAWANLADVYCMASTYDALKSSQARPLALAAAQRALSLDAGLAKAHAAYAYAISADLNHWRSADKFFKRAIALDPKDPTIRSWYAGFLGREGRFSEAVAMASSALDLDPGSFRLNYRMGTELFRAMQFEKLVSHMQNVVRLHPAEGLGFCLLARAYEWLKRFPEAEAALREADELPDKLASLAFWATLFAAKGSIAAAAKATEKIRSNWIAQISETNVYLTALGSLAMALGERSQSDRIVATLNEGIRRQDETVLAAAANPYMQVAKKDPRILGIFKRLDLA